MTGPSSNSAYAELERLFARLHHLGQASSLLGWDRQVVMPDGAAPARGETLAALAGLSHALLTDPRAVELLNRAETELATENETDEAALWRRANLREMRAEHVRATAAPAALVEALTRAETRGEMAWRRARAEDDFAVFLPALAEMRDLQRELGQALGAALDLSLYDALLDRFEPGARVAWIEPLFDELAAFLPGFLAETVERQRAAGPIVAPKGPFPVGIQRALGAELMRVVGFDFQRGRLDVSLHPFCGGADDDIRITTRYDEADFTSALMGVLHETGHALYEQGLPQAWRTQPVGQARGMMLHESQSLLIEMQVCRGSEFLGFAAARMRAAFDATARRKGWSDAALSRLYRRVEPGLIRVEADEVSYPLHVILRMRLERAMLSDDLKPADLPDAWREAMTALLGVAPASDAEGCLQDIHWADGAWGYFPCYTLGALAAAQLYQAALAETPEIPERVADGDFDPLVGWLRRRVHQRASLLDADALIREATGAPFATAGFIAHLERRYGDGRD